MPANPPVSYADLLDAFEWVSASADLQNSAFVSRKTGCTHWASETDALEDALPEDIDDASIYVAVPHKHDLDLGSTLTLRFAEEKMPEAADTVAAFFRQRGAYARFKNFLEQKGVLQVWYDYEAEAVERALRDWSDEQGLQLKA